MLAGPSTVTVLLQRTPAGSDLAQRQQIVSKPGRVPDESARGRISREINYSTAALSG